MEDRDAARQFLLRGPWIRQETVEAVTFSHVARLRGITPAAAVPASCVRSWTHGIPVLYGSGVVRDKVVVHDFCDIPSHIQDSVRAHVPRVASYGRRVANAVAIGIRPFTRRQLVAPWARTRVKRRLARRGITRNLASAARSLLPFGLGGQPLPEPAAERIRPLPVDIHHGVVREFVGTVVRIPSQTPRFCGWKACPSGDAVQVGAVRHLGEVDLERIDVGFMQRRVFEALRLVAAQKDGAAGTRTMPGSRPSSTVSAESSPPSSLAALSSIVVASSPSVAPSPLDV